MLSYILIKTRQNSFLCLPQNPNFYIQVHLGKCIYCYCLYILALLYWLNDVHIINIQIKTAFSMYFDIILYCHTITRGPRDPASLTIAFLKHF